MSDNKKSVLSQDELENVSGAGRGKGKTHKRDCAKEPTTVKDEVTLIDVPGEKFNNRLTGH